MTPRCRNGDSVVTLHSTRRRSLRANAAVRCRSGPRREFADYFRCPGRFDGSSRAACCRRCGFFRFGDAMCYGALAATASRPSDLVDASAVTAIVSTRALPFDLAEVVTNLRRGALSDRRTRTVRAPLAGRACCGTLYYFVAADAAGRRPQASAASPAGAVGRTSRSRAGRSTTVGDQLMRDDGGLALESRRIERIPFIWFWPDGAPSCAMMTHDVEGAAGAAFCGELMDLDDSFGIKSAFQLVPEAPCQISTARCVDAASANRGFEVNLHDLNHDGHLFDDREQFLRRAAAINRYAREFDCRGFRSGAMYREQDVVRRLRVLVRHVGAQRRASRAAARRLLHGDAVFRRRHPRAAADDAQDYSLFHILGDYSTALWKRADRADRAAQRSDQLHRAP